MSNPRKKTAAAERLPGADYAAARSTLQKLIDKSPHATLRAMGQVAYLYAVEIDAALAEEVLKHSNWRNRVMRASKVLKHQKHLTDWRLQNPIMFSDRGELLDGQHRLMAVQESGGAAPFLIHVVETDETDAANAASDIGAPRSLADYLHFHGVPNPHRIAPVLVFERNARVTGSPLRRTEAEREDYLRIFKTLPSGLMDAALGAVPAGFHRRNGLKRPIVDWVALQLAHVDASSAKLFFELIDNPAGLNEDEPCYMLSRKFLEMAARRLSGTQRSRFTAMEQMVLLVKGWNAFFEGRRTTGQELRYRPRMEDFPVVLGKRS